MNDYEARQEARRQRLEAAAERAEKRAVAAYRSADLREEVSGIPFGQPVLVGHHSERRHRKALERADNAMRRSIDESKRAADLRAKADGVGRAGISSDDPEAVAKLREKLAKLEDKQAMMRNANKVLRRHLKRAPELRERGPDCAAFATYFADLKAVSPAATAASAAEFLKPDFCGRIGFPSYALSNNNANMKRIKDRIANLERAAERETTERVEKGVRIVENAEENRLQLFFDGKPSAEIRTELKSAGFRWARYCGAWQRQLGNGARWAAERVISKI